MDILQRGLQCFREVSLQHAYYCMLYHMLMLAMYSKQVVFKIAILGQNAGAAPWDLKVSI